MAKNLERAKDLETCHWCLPSCRNCYYSAEDEYGYGKCVLFPDSPYHQNLVKYDQRCGNWRCYKEKREEV